MGRRVTILGMGVTAIERRWDILRYCEGTEIWGLNDGLAKWGHIAASFARWFILYDHAYLQQVVAQRQDWDNWGRLDRLNVPVYAFDVLPQIRNQVRYPAADVFGKLPAVVMLGSPALMLALAVHEGADYIQSYGIDQLDAEHGAQRGAWGYWCGVAHARGIELGGTALAWNDNAEDAGMIGRRAEVVKQIKERA